MTLRRSSFSSFLPMSTQVHKVSTYSKVSGLFIMKDAEREGIQSDSTSLNKHKFSIPKAGIPLIILDAICNIQITVCIKKKDIITQLVHT